MSDSVDLDKRELQRFVIPSGVSLKVDLGYLEVDGTLRRMQYLFCALERELQERIAFRGGSVDDPITDESTAKIKRWFEEKERGQSALELLREIDAMLDASKGSTLVRNDFDWREIKALLGEK